MIAEPFPEQICTVLNSSMPNLAGLSQLGVQETLQGLNREDATDI